MRTEALQLPQDFCVDVKTTQNRGFTPEEVAERCADRIISISDTAPLAISEQAKAFKRQMEKILAFYMREAIRSDRTTIFNAIKDAGHPDLAEMIRRI